MERPLNLAFEIGTEEIPSAPLYSAMGQLNRLATQALEKARIPFDDIQTFATPRRLILKVTALAQESEGFSERIKGPSVAAAYDAECNPTKALLGFAKSKGIEIDSLEEVDEGGARYLYAITEHESVPTLDILPGLLTSLISDIEWKKSMRWGSTEERFVRPIRWLLALYGQRVVPVSFAGVHAGRLSRGHRLLAPMEFSVAAAEGLIPSLENVYVVPQVDLRVNTIKGGIERIEAELGARAIIPDATFNEVVNLVEYPTVAYGSFDHDFLDVPREIITDAMLSHQRYFPLEDATGALLDKFIVVHNGDPEHTAGIVAGHERVIRARLADAAFFYREDLKRPLEEYVSDLKDVMFQEKLGTVLDKVNRMMGLTGELAGLAGLDEPQTLECLRATLLAKADLVTSAVIEFPSLQGIMGGYYAKAAGETDAVAAAIPEHYAPRFSGDVIPSQMPGILTAISDKLDMISGLFAIGQAPTGSSDPFALRRAALGVIAILIEYPLFPLSQAIELAIGEYDGVIEFDRDATIEAVTAFFRARLQGVLKDRGYAYDTIDAVLAANVLDPKDASMRCEALQVARDTQKETFDDLATAYTRASKITDVKLGSEVDTALFSDAEKDLFASITRAEDVLGGLLDSASYAPALAELARLREPIDTFFEEVLVMDEDLALRQNRLHLLNRFVKLFAQVADFSKMGSAS